MREVLEIGIDSSKKCEKKNWLFSTSYINVWIERVLMLDYLFCLVYRFDFSQEYIPHGYKELCLAPTKDGEV